MRDPDDLTRLPIRVKRKNKRAVMDLLRSILVLVIIAGFVAMCAAGERYFKG